MIIQCEQCSTKFRLDDSKVTDKGVKVRCAKCRHVFTVRNEQYESEVQPDLDAMLNQPQPDFGAMLDQSAAFTPEEPSDPQQESPAAAAAPDSGFDYSDFVSHDFAEQAPDPDGGGFDLPTGESAPISTPNNDFSLSALEGDQGFALEQNGSPAAAGAGDFDEFVFAAGETDADKSVASASEAFDFGDVGLDRAQAVPSAAGALDGGALDFGDIAMGPIPTPEPALGTENAAMFDFGGEVNFGEKETAPLSGEAAEQFSFDSGVTGDVAQPAVAENATVEEAPLLADEPKGRDSFSLGKVEIGDEPVVEPAQQAETDKQEQPQEALVAPSEPQGMPGEVSPVKEPAVEELPPLSIASRRKQSPLFGVLIAVATVVAVAVLGFFGYTMFLEDKGKVVTEAGRITVRAVNASFVKNQVVGDLLVITGEAVNSYSKPRAAIQVKGIVYGANGQTLVSKNAYCGNPLTKEQLSTMSLDKIEAAMANQFGDSLANMEVVPGKAIPFVIAIPKTPAEAKDYGVEPAGSTVATGKQQ